MTQAEFIKQGGFGAALGMLDWDESGVRKQAAVLVQKALHNPRNKVSPSPFLDWSQSGVRRQATFLVQTVLHNPRNKVAPSPTTGVPRSKETAPP